MELFKELGLNGLLLGNILASIVGLIFTFGIPKKDNKKEVLYWGLFWVSLLSGYVSRIIWVFIPDHPLYHLFSSIGDSIGTIGIALLFFTIYRKNKNSAKQVLSFLVPILVIGYLAQIYFQNYLFSNILTSLLLILIAWSVRLKDITSSMLILGYGILQSVELFSGMTEDIRSLLTKNYEVVLILKLSLIIAIYKILDVNKKT